MIRKLKLNIFSVFNNLKVSPVRNPRTGFMNKMLKDTTELLTTTTTSSDSNYVYIRNSLSSVAIRYLCHGYTRHWLSDIYVNDIANIIVKYSDICDYRVSRKNTIGRKREYSDVKLGWNNCGEKFGVKIIFGQWPQSNSTQVLIFHFFLCVLLETSNMNVKQKALYLVCNTEIDIQEIERNSCYENSQPQKYFEIN